MRSFGLCALGLVLFCSLGATQEPKQERIPVGLQRARETRKIPSDPPLFRAKDGPADTAQLGRYAEELAKLAVSIPADISELERGLHPKDLGDKLKRIEKLTRHLRRELSR